MREYFDRVGKIVPRVVELSRRDVYYGHSLYNRLYGYYSYNIGLGQRWKMKRRNG
jgi:hypothetical protein